MADEHLHLKGKTLKLPKHREYKHDADKSQEHWEKCNDRLMSATQVRKDIAVTTAWMRSHGAVQVVE